MTQLSTINNQTMSSREIADLIEKRHDNIKVSADRLAEKGVIGTPAMQEFTHNGNVYTEYLFTKRDSLILVAQNCPEFTARIVDRWQELEAQAAKPVAVLPQTYIEALEQLLQAKKAEQLAIETKAQIGARREATAMNTASQAVKRANQLQIELDKSKQYASVKRMEMLYHGQKFDWRLLKSTAAQMEVSCIDVFDANYGTVKAYHADVWKEAYAVSIEAMEAA
jgi:phage regulator Rha-like protein